jgi:hypothetical protein
MGLLDLSDANLKGFEALDAGRYDAEIVELSMDAVKNTDGTGKMPAGTPMVKAQFRVLNPKIDGEVIDQDRRAWKTYIVPPKGHDPKKAATMKGMIARFFMALGVDEEKVTAPDFDPDFEDFEGAPCVITLSKIRKYGTSPEDNEWDNRVTGVKKAGAPTGGGALL